MTKIKFALALMLLIWILGFFIEFFIKFSPGLILLHPFLDKTYSGLCHQDPQKAIISGISHTLVCSRCAGIYIGAFLSSLIAILHMPKFITAPKYLVYAGIPMLADVALASLGVYSYSKTLAFLTGLLLGSVSFFYILYGLQKYVEDFSNKRMSN